MPQTTKETESIFSSGRQTTLGADMSVPTVSVIVQMHDKTRKAEVALSRSTTTKELLEETKRNWSLPNVDYRVTNITKNKELLPKDQFTEENVSDKDVLQIEPILVAG